MRTRQKRFFSTIRPLAAIVGLALILPIQVQAGAVSGPDGRALFEEFRDKHDGQFIDFTYGVAPIPIDRRLDTEFLASDGVEFQTFLTRELNPILPPWHVYVSAIAGRVDEIVGVSCSVCGDDGQYPYRIVFTTPQRYAGIVRHWTDKAITRFRAPDDSVLYETHVSTSWVKEFQGYVADSADTSTWVKWIELNGDLDGPTRQVGYTDDLFFGTVIPAECDFIVLPMKNGGAMTGCL